MFVFNVFFCGESVARNFFFVPKNVQALIISDVLLPSMVL